MYLPCGVYSGHDNAPPIDVIVLVLAIENETYVSLLIDIQEGQELNPLAFGVKKIQTFAPQSITTILFDKVVDIVPKVGWQQWDSEVTTALYESATVGNNENDFDKERESIALFPSDVVKTSEVVDALTLGIEATTSTCALPSSSSLCHDSPECLLSAGSETEDKQIAVEQIAVEQIAIGLVPTATVTEGEDMQEGDGEGEGEGEAEREGERGGEAEREMEFTGAESAPVSESVTAQVQCNKLRF